MDEIGQRIVRLLKCGKKIMFFDIYSVIWHLLQFIFDIVEFVCRLGTFAKAKCKIIQRRFGGEDISIEKILIERNKAKLTKIPNHLAVILGTELPDFRALSKIIFWCLSAGIQNISFYDHRGNFHNTKFLYLDFEKFVKNVMCGFLLGLQVFWCQTITKSTITCRDGEKTTTKSVGIRINAIFVAVK